MCQSVEHLNNRLLSRIHAAFTESSFHLSLRCRFIFRDVKSANLFLDKLNNPRFGDYGLVVTEKPDFSRTFDSRNTSSTTSTYSSGRQLKSSYGSCIKGTQGWVCPIYNTTHKLDQRCDLWGFGMGKTFVRQSITYESSLVAFFRAKRRLSMENNNN